MSKLIKGDSRTEQSNAVDGFKPATETEKYSYTSARVATPVYNRYKKANKPKVFGYYTDWSQYDGRLQGQDTPESRGRGYDLANVAPTAYDKIIFGFLGIVGDQGEKQFTINNAASQTGKVTHEPTFLDPWGDFQSSANCNVPEGGWDVDPKTVTQSSTYGLLGGLRELQAKAKTMGHDLALSMSIGGWTMSNGFHEMAKTDASRKVFAAGVVKLFKQFPMFSEVDIDWEYPNNAGNGNPHGPEDGANYAMLIKELKTQLNAAGRSDVKVSIASSAVVDVLGYSNVKALMDAGLYGINVMTYDFFGTPWAAELTHHTNLTPLTEGSWSVEAVVDYLIAEGFPSDRINIGYAGYTRNARNAEISSFSPLKGTYAPGQGTTTGTFESGSTEWYDTIYNYLDLENQKGRNGFNVYTDKQANADYLYNPQSKLFMSLDTPRSVKVKGEYAAERNLGGLFTWTIDQDNGVLLNAAREGLGYAMENEVVDMEPFYFEGINVDPTDKEDDEQKDDETPAENLAPEADVETFIVGGARMQFSAKRSEDADGDALTYQWKVPANVKASSMTAEVIEVETPVVTAETTLVFSVVAKDSKGAESEAVMFFVKVVPALEISADEEPEEQPQDDDTDNQPEPTPEDETATGTWDAGVIYVENDEVTYNGHRYLAGWWNQDKRPDMNCGEGQPWKDLGAI